MIQFIKNLFCKSKNVTNPVDVERQSKIIAKLKIEKDNFFLDKDKEIEKKNDDLRAENNLKDSTCPRCSSTDVVDKIVRSQGELKGNSVCGTGSIKGKWDTKPVNRCKKCEHEWIKNEISYFFQLSTDIYYQEIRIRHYINSFDEVVFNPLDMNERYSTLEEKIKMNEENHLQHWWCSLSNEWKENLYLNLELTKLSRIDSFFNLLEDEYPFYSIVGENDLDLSAINKISDDEIIKIKNLMLT